LCYTLGTGAGELEQGPGERKRDIGMRKLWLRGITPESVGGIKRYVKILLAETGLPAKTLGCSPSAVGRAFKKLRENGYLDDESRHKIEALETAITIDADGNIVFDNVKLDGGTY